MAYIPPKKFTEQIAYEVQKRNNCRMLELIQINVFMDIYIHIYTSNNTYMYTHMHVYTSMREINMIICINASNIT